MGRIVAAAENKLHVGLAGTDPIFHQKEDVVDGERILPETTSSAELAGVHRRECDAPLAGGVGRGSLRLPGDGHCYSFARIGPAPDGNLHVALENHVIAEKERQFDIRSCDGDGAQQ